MEKYAYPKIKSVGFTYVPHLQNIKDIHLHSSNFEWEIAQRGNAQTVYILSVTAIVLLVIACLNFINLSTARAIKRMKEVGVRKVIGAVRNQLVLQFISESVVITIVGLVFSIVVAQLATSLSEYAGRERTFITILMGNRYDGASILHFSEQSPAAIRLFIYRSSGPPPFFTTNKHELEEQQYSGRV